jgi:hypothetical protein
MEGKGRWEKGRTKNKALYIPNMVQVKSTQGLRYSPKSTYILINKVNQSNIRISYQTQEPLAKYIYTPSSIYRCRQGKGRLRGRTKLYTVVQSSPARDTLSPKALYSCKKVWSNIKNILPDSKNHSQKRHIFTHTSLIDVKLRGRGERKDKDKALYIPNMVKSNQPGTGSPNLLIRVNQSNIRGRTTRHTLSYGQSRGRGRQKGGQQALYEIWI